MEIKLTKVCFLKRKRLLLIIMRTFIFLCCATVFALTPNNLVSQHSKVKIAEDESLTVDEVFDLIMEQTEYKFFYEEGIFKDFPKIQVQKGRISTNMLLNQSLAKGNFNIEVTANNAILIKEKSPNPILESQQSKEIQVTISGTITDENNQPLPGANIVEKGTTNGTQADFDGNFSLTLGDQNAVLIVSYIGYSTKEIAIKGSTFMAITLQENSADLKEVIVTGVAVGTPKTKLAFSIDKVQSENLERVPGNDAATALQGKIAGVKITKTSGAPGSESDIQLRGVKTIFGSSNPLIIIDGVLTSGGLADVNSQDILSIEVLKGAAASSLYGSRAANGVVSIITKRGNSIGAGKTEVNFRSEFGQNIMGFIPKKSTATSRVIELNPTTGQLEVTPLGADDQIADNKYPKTYNNLEQFFSPGSYYTNYLSLKGNSKDSRMSVYSSLETTNETGVVRLVDGLARSNFRLNLDYKINDKLTFRTSNLFAQTKSDDRGNGAFGQLMNTDPDANLLEFNEDGSPYKVNVNKIAQASNPLYTIANTLSEHKTERLLSYFELKYNPLDFLTFEASYGTDRGRVESFFLNPKGTLDYTLTPSSGSISRGNSISKSQTVQFGGSYFKSFGKFNTRFKALYIYESDAYHSLTASGTDLGVSGTKLTTVDLAANKSGSSYEEKTIAANIAGLLMLDYDDKYIFDGLIRSDASSRFGADVRNQIFYRVAGAWRLTEDFKISGIDEWKIRSSYGVSGLRPPFEARYETYVLQNGLTSSQYTLGNRNLKPSFSKEFEAGTDIRFLNNYNFSFNYSKAINTDQILKVPLPALAGAPFRWENAGEVISHALEMTLSGNIINSEAFNWNASLTFDKIQQKISRLDTEPYFLNGTRFRIEEGIDFGTLYLDRFAKSLDEVQNQVPEGGSDVNDYFTVNNQGYVVKTTEIGTVNEKPVKIRDDEGNIVPLPSTNFTPDFNMNYANTISYKGFTLYTLLAWQQGGRVYNHSVRYTTEPQIYDQSDKPWNAVKPIKYYENSGQEGGLLGWDNENLIYDATFLKLREASLGYELTSLESIGFKRIGFNLIGRNLLTFTKYPGFDPESGTSQEGVDTNVFKFDSNNSYPVFRTVSFSITLTF